MDLKEFKKKIKQKNRELYLTVNDPETNIDMKFSIYNKTTFWRANTLYTKEPTTIKWIRNFKSNSVFFDVGANVGMFSVFAASISKSRVYSFEPESNNFQVLMENILFNKLFNKISSYQIALGNKTYFTKLFIDTFTKGSSHHMLGEPLDHNLEHKSYKINQGVFSTTLDDLIDRWNFPVPKYLKIDVDGIEYKIINSSKSLLKNKKLESVLIEIKTDREKDREIIESMLSYGFIFNKEQVEKSTIKEGAHKGYAEYIFYRK